MSRAMAFRSSSGLAPETPESTYSTTLSGS